MTLAILSIGTAVPPTSINQTQGLAIARLFAAPTEEQATWLPGMYTGTGIERRHVSYEPEVVRDAMEGTRHSASVYLPSGAADDRGPTTGRRMEDYARCAPPIALEASRQVLTANAPAVTHLVTVSCTGFMAPGIDRVLITELGLNPTVERTHVGFMGCHGALNGLRAARAYADSQAACVLLCAVELCSLHYHYTWNPQKMVANAIFADGAAALLGVPEEIAPPGAWRLVANGSCYLPNSADAMTWNIGDHGFEMTLAKNVPGVIAKQLRGWIDTWLASQGLSVPQIRTWAIHPGGPKILDAAESALGLTRADTAVSREVFAQYGNMSSPTILFILKRLIEGGAERPCVCLGFGPGLVVEAALLM